MNPPRQKKRTGSRVRTGETDESKKIEKDKVKTNKQTNTERYPFKIKEESTEMCKILS